jgi:deoxyribose-phosphate aldolase
MDAGTLAGMLDQTLLKPTVGEPEGREWLRAQRDLGFASVCVTPLLVPAAVGLMRGTGTRVCTVVGFPLGYETTDTKVFAAAELVRAGAREIDMVVRIGDLLAGRDDDVCEDIESVVRAVEAVSDGRGLVKVILETGYLDDDTIRRGCDLAERSGAAFVKTSTGFGPRGANVADVAIMREVVGDRLGVKAAGGIRTTADALALIEAGASRIGTSAGDVIVAGLAEV